MEEVMIIYKVDELKLKKWTLRRLKKAGIDTINELIGMSKKELKRIKLHTGQINEVFQKLSLFRKTKENKKQEYISLINRLNELKEASLLLDKQILNATKELEKQEGRKNG